MSSKLSRRNFIALAPALAVTVSWLRASGDVLPKTFVFNTVTGPVSATDLGTMLPHEHVLVDFIGADKITPERYDEEEAYRVILPHLMVLKALGCKCLGECTPAYLGRNPRLLKRLSEASGIRIITNTGLYGAAGHKFLPAYVQAESAQQLANRWIIECRQGIENTGIYPGFMKLAADKGPLTTLQRKLIEAACITHKSTGLNMGMHSGDGAAALEAVAILEKYNVSPAVFTWIHAQNEKNLEIHDRLARKGVMISLDSLHENSAADYVIRLLRLKKNGLLKRVVLSHDAGWYHVGENGGGSFRDYNYLFASFTTQLIQHGFTPAEIKTLTVRNPASVFGFTPPASRQVIRKRP